MDVQLIHTFLEVNRTRHFARASEVLCVTQAAVSARIAQLENLVGAPLFIRQRNNIQLTAAGERLLPQAEAVVTAWNRLLLHSVGTRSDKEVIAVGCLPSIGEIFFEASLASLADELPGVFLQLELLNSVELLPRLRTRSIDVGFLYEPVAGPNLKSVKFAEVPLVLVASVDAKEADLAGIDFVQLDWGASYSAPVVPTCESLMSPLLRVDSTRMARNVLLSRPAAARLPLQQVETQIRSGELFLLDYAEPIKRELYLIHHESMSDEDVLGDMIRCFRALLN